MSVSPCNDCDKDCPESGCVTWKKWFVKYWNDNICVKPEPKGRAVFQYEHPDRVRETEPKKPEEMTDAEWMAKHMEGNHDA